MIATNLSCERKSVKDDVPKVFTKTNTNAMKNSPELYKPYLVQTTKTHLHTTTHNSSQRAIITPKLVPRYSFLIPSVISANKFSAS